ncbi:MAG: prolipoprotein diacylglyceryl transferase [Maricaulaceae bacterium]
MIELINAIPFPDWLDPIIMKVGPLQLGWYGLGYVVGVGLAFYYATRLVKNSTYWIPNKPAHSPLKRPDPKMLEDFAFYCMVGIMVGGRLGSILLYNTADYIANPIEIFKVWKGGMAFHGGFLGVCVATLYVAKRYKISLWRWADMAAVGAPIGIFLVRIANFINQELWGRPTDVAWAFIFETDPLSLPRHPSQLYEAFLEGIMVFLIIRLLVTRFKALSYPGMCAGAFMLFYGIFRFSVEFVREPDRIPQISEYFTRGMAYSLPMIIIGAFIMMRSYKKGPFAPAPIKAAKSEAPTET